MLPRLSLLLLAPLLALAACGARVDPPEVLAAEAPVPAAPAAAEVTAAAFQQTWQRVVVMGASMSAGFGLEAELGKRTGFHAVLEAMIDGERDPVVNFAGPMVFLDPFGLLKNQFEKAQLADPTLVFALDYLFWYVYGYKEEEAHRVRDLEVGLGMLAQFECPVLIATIPDMSEAVGKMLREEQMPAAASLEAANARILAFAAKHEQVRVVPMPDFLEQLRSGKEVAVGGARFAPDELDGLLQWDRLHPSLTGAAAVAALALETLLEGHPEGADADLQIEPRAAADRVRIGLGMERSEDGTWYRPEGRSLRELVPRLTDDR